MLLGQRKTQGEEKNWSIILNPIRSEIDKRRVSKKISEAFSLSPEEAADLVSNTPIILLDNLSRNDAVRVKEYFQSAGAEIMLTNDVYLKRKCYRTVWPEPPNLSFIKDGSGTGASKEQQAMGVEEALDELHSLSGSVPSETLSPNATDEEEEEELSAGEKDELLDEIHHWKAESIAQKAEVQRLREELEGFRRERVTLSQSQADNSELIRKREKEIEELQMLLGNAEEKYEGLKEEYREARAILEDKLSKTAQAVQGQEVANGEVSEKIQVLERLRADLERAIARQEEKYLELEQKYRQAREQLEQQGVESNQVLTSEKARVEEMTQRIHALEKSKRAAELDAENQKQMLEASLDQNKDFEHKVIEANQEKLQWKARAEEMQQQIQQLETSRDGLETDIKQQSDQAALWKQRADDQDSQLRQMQGALEKEQHFRMELERKIKDMEAVQLRYVQDLESLSRESRQRELHNLELEKKNSEMKQLYENHIQDLDEKLKAAETRERELESLRRQMREMSQQMEQRESIQRRNFLVNQLVEKEARLKKLVKEQEHIETDIREREESMRKILSEQEALEKEIIEGKQAERHLLEQMKKDKTLRVRATKSESGLPRPVADNSETSLD